ncbi:hypothetical protein HDU92_008633 [Lobulomyces angularis]|nr:hypothetical protein HDU92_008633 [Lobulomyces angularis]
MSFSEHNLKFYELCFVLERLESAFINLTKSKPNDRKKYKQIIKDIINSLQKSYSGKTLQLLRLLIPNEDIDRKYNIKEKSLANHLIKILGLNGIPRGERLKDWSLIDDLSIVLYDTVYSAEPCISKEFTLHQINSLLDELASLSAFSDQKIQNSKSNRTVKDILHDLFYQQRATESKWLVRIILKNLEPLSFSKEFLLFNYNRYFPSIFKNIADLEASCDIFDKVLLGQVQNLENLMTPKFGICYETQKTGKATSVDFVCKKVKEWQDVAIYSEIKYDGERMQIHFNADAQSEADQIKIFSKSRRNSTKERYLSHDIIRAMLGYPPKKFSIPSTNDPFNETTNVVSCILEAELLSYDEKKDKIEPFGYLQHYKETTLSTKILTGERHLFLVIFDILHFNGKSLINFQLKERKKLLHTIIRPIKNYAKISEARIIYNDSNLKINLENNFKEVLTRAEEGLIIKGYSSVYKPGDFGHYLKLKRDQIPEFGDTEDFVILGASFESSLNFVKSNEKFKVNRFWVGFLANELNQECAIPKFKILFKVDAGLGIKERKELNMYLFGEKSRTVKFNDSKNLQRLSYQFKQVCPGRIGSSFALNESLKYFVLRHPVILRWHKNVFDRTWRNGCTFKQLQNWAKLKTSAISDEVNFNFFEEGEDYETNKNITSFKILEKENKQKKRKYIESHKYFLKQITESDKEYVSTNEEKRLGCFNSSTTSSNLNENTPFASTQSMSNEDSKSSENTVSQMHIYIHFIIIIKMEVD